MDLKRMIEIIEKIDRSRLLESVLSPEDLLIALKELDALIGMKGLKDSICEQVMYLFEQRSNNFQDTMLHTVLYGPPGTGKTKVGLILCKIWTAIGCLTTGDKKEAETSGTVEKASDSDMTEMKNKKVFKEIKRISDSILTDTENLKKRIRTNDYVVKETISKVKDGIVNIYNLSYNENDSTTTEDTAADTKSTTKNMEPDAAAIAKDVVTVVNAKLASLPGKKRYQTRSQCKKIIDKLRDARLTSSSDDDFIADSDEEDDEYYETSDGTDETDDTDSTSAAEDGLVDDALIGLEPTKTGPFVIVGREDFIAAYTGQTSIKTIKLLNANIGKVIFIDEAYSLITGDEDEYGMEALTVLNMFMSQHPNKLVVIFAGYEKLMQETIFKYQPGLKSRCTWVHKTEGYDCKDLYKIFKSQVESEGWKFDDTASEDNITKLFSYNMYNLSGYGRDTKRLLHFSKMEHSKHSFEKSLLDRNYVSSKILSQKNIESGLEKIKQNQSTANDAFDHSKSHMYV